MKVLEESVDRMFPGFGFWIKLLVKDPVGIYNMLREGLGDGADIVLRILLRKLTDDVSLINKVVESLKKGDPSLFN